MTSPPPSLCSRFVSFIHFTPSFLTLYSNNVTCIERHYLNDTTGITPSFHRAEMSCLMQAARDGYSKVINLLASHGAQIDTQDANGYTVGPHTHTHTLSLACWRCYTNPIRVGV